MNILYIAHDKNLSGASRSLLEIISYVEKNNKVFVLISSKDGDFYQELKKHNCQIICLPFYLWRVTKTSKWKWIIKKIRWFIWAQFVNEMTAKKLSEIVKKEKIEIIHTNTGVCEIGARIRKRCPVKHVWHIREFADLDFNMYPLPQYKFYCDFMKYNTDLFIFNSYAVKKHYDFLKMCNTKVIYNGISEHYFIEDEEKESHECVHILISGRVSLSKGQDQAIKACEGLINEGILNFKLFIAGQGTIEYNHTKELDKRIVFLGVQHDMKSLRKKMDIELVCSCSEAFGRVTVEAMYAGIPVIGSNVGGTPEIIQDCKTGFLYEINNIEDLKNKMKVLIINKKLRDKMGHEARLYAHSKFKYENCMNQIVKTYNTILQDGVLIHDKKSDK